MKIFKKAFGVFSCFSSSNPNLLEYTFNSTSSFSLNNLAISLSSRGPLPLSKLYDINLKSSSYPSSSPIYEELYFFSNPDGYFKFVFNYINTHGINSDKVKALISPERCVRDRIQNINTMTNSNDIPNFTDSFLNQIPFTRELDTHNSVIVQTVKNSFISPSSSFSDIPLFSNTSHQTLPHISPDHSYTDLVDVLSLYNDSIITLPELNTILNIVVTNI